MTSSSTLPAVIGSLGCSDELEYLADFLKTAIVAAINESMPAEIRKVQVELQTVRDMLETISPAMSNAKIVREASRSSSQTPVSAPGPALNTLQQVRDKLFQEALIEKSPPSSPGLGLDKAASERSENKTYGKSYEVMEHRKEASASRNDKVRDACPGRRAQRGSPSPHVPGQVLPCPPEDQSEAFMEIASRPKTMGCASLSVQESIIRETCQPRSGTYYKEMPLSRCIIRMSFLFRMGLLLAILLRAALAVLVYIKYSIPITPWRDLAALIFSVAAIVSSMQLTKTKQCIEQAAYWSLETASGEAWLGASRKKQRWLLVWWASALLSMVPGEAGNFNRLWQFEHSDSIRTGCLWASQIATSLIFFFSITLLVPAAFLQCHIISDLDVFIDTWSCELCEARDFADSVVAWNTVQALIRRAGSSFENMFLTIQLCTLLGCVLMATQGVDFVLQPDWSWAGFIDIAGSLPLLLLETLAAGLLLQCAWITDKCSILAPVVNQIMTNPMDAGRQYLAQYLTDSAAGIYVQGVRLDVMMVVNIVYFLAFAIFGLFGMAMRFSNK